MGEMKNAHYKSAQAFSWINYVYLVEMKWKLNIRYWLKIVFPHYTVQKGAFSLRTPLLLSNEDWEKKTFDDDK